MSKLTPRQQCVYQFICDYIDMYASAPTLKEIATHLGIRGNLGVIRHLDALEKKGFLRRTAGRSRGISLVQRHCPPYRLPLVGTVAAGPLSEALENVEDYFSVDASLTGGKESFLLRVRGDSMIDAQIADGDLAVVHPQQTAENGDIVVARLDGDATLKRFYREGDRIRLQPENSHLKPILLSAEDGEIALVGKVTAIIRPLIKK